MGAPRSATSPLRPIVTSPRYGCPCNGKCGASRPHPPFLFGTTAVCPPVSRQVAPVLSTARTQHPPQSGPYAAITRHLRVAGPKTNAKDHRPVCRCNTATTLDWPIVLNPNPNIQSQYLTANTPNDHLIKSILQHHLPSIQPSASCHCHYFAKISHGMALPRFSRNFSFPMAARHNLPTKTSEAPTSTPSQSRQKAGKLAQTFRWRRVMSAIFNHAA